MGEPIDRRKPQRAIRMRVEDEHVIGRYREREQLERALEDARLGLAGALVIGEAGIGKTHLVRGTALEAERSGFRVLSAASAEVEQDLPYASLTTLLARVQGEVREALPPIQRRALEDVLVLGDHVEPIDPRAIGMAVVNTLGELGGRSPVALILDDLHWQDAASALALSFALRRLEGAPLVVIGSQRPHAQPALDLRAIVPLDRLRDVMLGPLDRESLTELIVRDAGGRPPLPVLHRALALSDGHPLMAIELARMSGTGADLPVSFDGRELPDRLWHLLGYRIVELPPDTRRAVAVVAVAAHPTDALLAQLDVAPDELAPAAATGVLRRDADRWEFSHPLLRSVAVSGLSGRAQADLHARLALLIDDPVERAGHVARSTTGTDEAAAALVAAGARAAARRGAPVEGAILADLAVELSDPGQAEPLVERLILAGELHELSGDRAAGLEALSRAVSLAPRAQRAAALIALAQVEMGSASGPTAIVHLRAALRAALDDRTRAEIRRLLADILRLTVRIDLARRHARHAARLAAGGLGDPELEARVLSFASLLDFNVSGRVDRERVDLALSRVELATPGHLSPRTAAAVVDLAHQLAWSGAFEDACRLLDPVVADPSLALTGVAADAAYLLAVAHLLSGRWSAAEQWFATHARMVVVRESWFELPASIAMRAVVLALQGDPRAKALAAQAREQAEQVGARRFLGGAWYATGCWELAEGDVPAAARSLRRAVEIELEQGMVVPSAELYVGDAIEALTMAGRLEDAQQMVEEVAHLTRSWHAAFLFRATFDRSRAVLALATGDVDAAARLLRPWRDPETLAHFPFHRGRTRLVSGMLDRRRHRRREARARLTAARDTFDALGALPWVRRAGAELASIGDRPGDRYDLTPAEARVARLVATGKRNREIADELFLSVKTVEWNLTRVYQKLGVRSRSEVAARLAAAGQPPGSTSDRSGDPTSREAAQRSENALRGRRTPPAGF